LQTARLKPFFYGLADLGPASIDIFLKVYLLLYFNVILGLSPTLTSLAIGLGVLWDALIDPWIGVYSDNYYKKNSHRKFIIYSAVIISVILFFILWRIPNLGEGLTFLFLFLISSFLNSAISLFSVPYIAVANDLETDNEKRKVWTGWRLAFFNLGSFLGLVVPAYFLTKSAATSSSAVSTTSVGSTASIEATTSVGAKSAEALAQSAAPYLHASLVLCMIMVACSFFSIWYVYRGQKFEPLKLQSDKKFRLLDLLRDPTFLRMMVSFFVFNCGLGLNSALALYYYKNYLGFTENQTQMILVGFLVVFTLSIPFWVVLTKYFQKQNLIMTGGFLLGLMTCLAFPHFSGVPFWIIFILAAVLGGILVGVAVVLEIYLSDFLKEKEHLTGQNVSGQYLGVWKMSSKISRAVAIAFAGPILESASNPQTLANYFGWGVGLFFMAGALLIMLPLNLFQKRSPSVQAN
jgi:GPH family glycoside/pentoside/hexuronide:cation symporter